MPSTARLDYEWKLRELMAQRGMYQTTLLQPELRERGIELSDSQVYRLVVDTPERISIKTLVALMDILGCGMEDLIRPVMASKSSARAVGERQSAEPGVGSFRPRRARVTGKDQ